MSRCNFVTWCGGTKEERVWETNVTVSVIGYAL